MALAAEGASVVIDYVADPDATEALEKQVRDLGDKVIGVKADVSKVADLQDAVRHRREARSVDWTSWSTTPASRPARLCSTPPRTQYERVLDINLKSAFFGTQLAAKQMIAQGDGGRIINITSVHEDWPMPGNTAYCLSKGGMRMLTRTAGVELAPHNVLVVGVGPGAVATPINTVDDERPDRVEEARRRHSLGRMAKPEEIGSVVAFLAGPRRQLS